jgi:hypothetical protein
MVASRPGGAAPRGRAVFATHVASQSFTRIDVKKKHTLEKRVLHQTRFDGFACPVSGFFKIFLGFTLLT